MLLDRSQSLNLTMILFICVTSTVGCNQFTHQNSRLEANLESASSVVQVADFEPQEQVKPAHFGTGKKEEGPQTVEEILLACRRAKIGTHAWFDVVRALQFHNDQKAREYLKEVIPSAPPFARAVGYKLCQWHQWDDLASAARADYYNPTYVGFMNTGDEYSLCGVAQNYLRSLQSAKPMCDPVHPPHRRIEAGITILRPDGRQ